jgi:hypothetical protein
MFSLFSFLSLFLSFMTGLSCGFPVKSKMFNLTPIFASLSFISILFTIAVYFI